jgi:hypothetical protein
MYNRVARFFMMHYTKMGKYAKLPPNGHKIYQRAVKYIDHTYFHEIHQHLPLQDPPKFTQIAIFGLKIPIPSGNPNV